MARHITPLQEEQIKKYLRLHWSDSEIASELHVSRDTVQVRRFKHCGGVLGMRSKPRKPRVKSLVDSREHTPSVYFIQAVSGGPVKIGYTAKDISHRLKELQAANPLPLRVVALMRHVPANVEKILHYQFREHRLHREWFEWCPEIECFVKELREGSEDDSENI